MPIFKIYVDGLEKVIDQLTEDQSKDKTLIGEAIGFSVAYCVHLGIKYETDFAKRVKYYSIAKPNRKDIEDALRKHPENIYVKFYE